MPEDTTQTDPSVVALMHGLKTAEGTNGDYTAMGDEGTAAGIGQWSNQVKGKPQPLAHGQIPANFSDQARRYGMDPSDFSPENQNKVMYAAIAADKKAGLTPEQILSKWNSGDPNKYQTDAAKGTGPVGKYNVADYVQRGMTAAQFYAKKNNQIAGQNQPAPDNGLLSGAKDFVPGVTSDLSNRLKTGSQAAASGIQGALTGNLEQAGSGALQTAGAAAGAVGDVVGRATEVIPGVKQTENGLGFVLGKIADTPLGKSVIGTVSDWAQAHPEAAANIGAAGNLFSVIPMFKAVGAVATAGKTALDKATVGALTKAAGNEIENGLGTSKAAKTLVSKGTIDTALSKGYLPEVVQDNTGKFVYSTAKADAKADAEESALEDKLQGMITSKSNSPISLRQARNNAIKSARDTMGRDPELERVENRIHSIFNFWENRFGNKQTLTDLTQNKRDVRKSVNFDSPAHEKDAAYHAGQGLMQAVEDTAASRGIPGVREVNAEMGKIINARSMLVKLEGKSPKVTKVGRFHKEIASDVLGGVGEAIGGATGLPFAGTLAGRGLAGLVKETPGKALRGLTRAKGPFPSVKQAIRRGSVGALLHNRQGMPTQ